MGIDRESYISHITDIHKQNTMKRLLDKIEISLSNHTIESSNFLDPYERYLAKSILNRFDDLSYTEFGGLEDSERQIILVYPYYLDQCLIESGLRFFRIAGDIEELSHKDFLDAILGTGINRSKVGDIQVHATYADVTIRDELGDFILFNLDKIGNKKVSVSEIDEDNLKKPALKFREINTFVTSLRLDVFLSTTYKLSRQESINIIKSGKVKLNWQEISKPSKELEIGDMISTKGFGRAILNSNDGMSKKGRYLINIRILT